MTYKGRVVPGQKLSSSSCLDQTSSLELTEVETPTMASRPVISVEQHDKYLEGKGATEKAPTKQARLGGFTILYLVLNRTIGKCCFG